MDATMLSEQQNRFMNFYRFGHFFGWGYFCCADRAMRVPV